MILLKLVILTCSNLELVAGLTYPLDMEKSTVANHLTREEGDTRKEQKDHGVEAQSTENVDNTRRLDGGLPFHR